MENVISPSCLQQTNDLAFPVVYELKEGTSVDDFAEFYRSNTKAIDEHLYRHGAITFNGLGIGSRAHFQAVVAAIGNRFINYIDGNSPRTKLSDIIYTSTEYDPSQTITQHNELSYSANWPSRIFFCCIKAAATGGETPLADGRKVLAKMDKQIVHAIESKGLTYIRNLHGGNGFGPSWQHTFETTDAAKVEEHCRNLSMEFEWKEDGTLNLKHHRKGIIRHAVTGEKVWFNQIDQFHPTHLGRDVYEVLSAMYGCDEELPTSVTFGDGTPIGDNMVREIMETINSVIVAKPWEEGQLLLVDNELVSHGRKPFTGEREVLVSMMK